MRNNQTVKEDYQNTEGYVYWSNVKVRLFEQNSVLFCDGRDIEPRSRGELFKIFVARSHD